MTQNPKALAVLVKGWPRLSETFIAQELVALERAGLQLHLWSLRHPTDKKTHPLHDQLRAGVSYLPEYLRNEPLRVLRGLLSALRRPNWRAAWRAIQTDYARDKTRNRIRRFGQACVLARELPPECPGLYSHFLHTPSSVARYAAILRGLPWSFSAHAKDIWTSPDWDLQDKLNPATHGAVFGATCTQFGAEHLNQMSRGTPVDLIYHGLDLTRFPEPPKRTPGVRFTMLSVGRLVEKKGFDNLINALALLPKGLDWHWTHIGGGTLRDSLRTRAERLGITDRITWRGACDQPEVIAAMRDAELFVLPSRVAADGDRDGLPNVLMEAASQLLPILSTPVSAIPEFIDTGVHGTLSNDEPEALAAAIHALAKDPTRRMQMAGSARERLVREFAMQPGIDALAMHLREMMG